jgi:ABC-type multidrug transport system fused ATPase/permease subunit
MTDGFQAVPTDASPTLPTDSSEINAQFLIFLIYCVVTVILVLFFFFYLNRVTAWCISKVVSLYTYRKYQFHIEVESARISFLSGKLFFKNLRYFSSNMGVSVVQGYITFRYWLLNVRKSTSNAAEEIGDIENGTLRKMISTPSNCL